MSTQNNESRPPALAKNSTRRRRQPQQAQPLPKAAQSVDEDEFEEDTALDEAAAFGLGSVVAADAEVEKATTRHSQPSRGSQRDASSRPSRSSGRVGSGEAPDEPEQTEPEEAKSAKASLQRTNQAIKDNSKDLVVESVKGAVRGGKAGGKLGTVVPGVGNVAGAAIGAAVGASEAQARVGRESGDPGMAYLTAQSGGGVVGGVVNAKLAKNSPGRDAAQSEVGRAKGDGEAEKRRRRTQRQRVHKHRAGVVKLEKAVKQADPESQRDVKKVDEAADRVNLTSREDKTMSKKIGDKALGKGMADGGQSDDVVAAFTKGFAGGVGHVGRHRIGQSRTQTRANGASLPQPAEVAGGFGYDSRAAQVDWTQQRTASPTTGRQAAAAAVKNRQAAIAEEKAQQAQIEAGQEKKVVTYTPSIPIEQVDGDDIGMEK